MFGNHNIPRTIGQGERRMSIVIEKTMLIKRCERNALQHVGVKKQSAVSITSTSVKLNSARSGTSIWSNNKD